VQRPRKGFRGEHVANIGLRIRRLRQQRGLTQQGLERATGLNWRYISRVERGATVPSLKNLEKFAAALEVALYQFFSTGDASYPAPELSSTETLERLRKKGGNAALQARFLQKLMSLNTRLGDAERTILLNLATLLATRTDSRT
jgi:transcriptional regulator with XRE-family HTH domain